MEKSKKPDLTQKEIDTLLGLIEGHGMSEREAINHVLAARTLTEIVRSHYAESSLIKSTEDDDNGN